MSFKVSVVIPAYNEQDNLSALISDLETVLKPFPGYEVILVDDGSTDQTAERIKQLARTRPYLRYLILSRNFGHQYALKAGLDQASGDCVLSMDADGQHPARLIPDMIQAWKEGADIVYTLRADAAEESFFKRFTSRLYYLIFNWLSGLNLPAGSADFRLMDKKVVAVLRTLPEKSLFLRGLVFWMGFKQKALPYYPDKRRSGQSHYTFKKMMMLAVTGATSFSIKPLRMAVYLGLCFSFLGFLFIAYALYMRFTSGTVITGWASTISVILILGGVQLFIMGIIGEYIGLIFMEVKNRPSYLVRESNLPHRGKNFPSGVGSQKRQKKYKLTDGFKNQRGTNA